MDLIDSGDFIRGMASHMAFLAALQEHQIEDTEQVGIFTLIHFALLDHPLKFKRVFIKYHTDFYSDFVTVHTHTL